MALGLLKIIFKSHEHIIRDSSAKAQAIKLLTILFLLLALHAGAMIYFEQLPIGDAIWLTMTSATTVGYGDLSAQTAAGRIATIILLYIGGIAILAQVAALYFEHRQEIRNRMLKGDWSWTMNNHIVFINSPLEMDEEYFYHAILGLRQSNANHSKLPIIIVSDNFKDGIPDRLRNLEVVHVNRSIADQDAFEAANVLAANTIVILSRDRLDAISDSINFDQVYRLREMGFTGRIIVEAVKDENRTRLKKAGADNILRPIRTYPELLMRTILAPGSEQVIETLFDSVGEECIRYEVNIECEWIDIIQKITSHDLGIPIAYEDLQGEVINNPSSHSRISTHAIFVIVNKDEMKTSQEIEIVLKAV